MLQLKQLKKRNSANNNSNANKQSSDSSKTEQKEVEALHELYIGLCALMGYKINITQSREELMEKFRLDSLINKSSQIYKQGNGRLNHWSL